MKNQKLILLSALPILLAAQTETEVNLEIKSVTIYTSAAEISCEKDIDVQKGKSVFVFTDMTPYIEENSINISVSDPRVSIVTVTERINYTKEKKSNITRLISLRDTVKKLNKELGLVRVKKEVLSAEKNLLFKNEAIGGLSTQGVSVAEIEKASVFFNKRYGELVKDLYFLEQRDSEIMAMISNYERDMKETNTVSVKTMSEISVKINSTSDVKTKFSIKFLTRKSGWAPVYDFKFEGPEKPLQFVFRANVFNASGTDWQDVALKLSTADPIRGFTLPSLDQQETKINRSTEEIIKFKQIEIVNAITEYKISHEYSIPSDSKPYLIDVNANSMPASFNYLLIPKADPFGFLMAKIPGWNNYNLIPGTTNIYNMGTYMGRTFLNTYSENDTLSLYLGKDKNIQCIRTEKSIEHKNFLIGNYATEETTTDIIVKNNSNGTYNIEILDQVPVIEKDDKEKLFVTDESKLNYDKSEGLIKWRTILKPGENYPISFKYEIKTPKELYDRYGKPKHKKFRTVSCPAF